MQSPYLDRIRSWRRGSASWLRWVLALLSAVVLCAMTLLGGAAIHFLVARDAAVSEVAAPTDPLLGGLIRELAAGRFGGVPQITWICGLLAGFALVLWLLWRMMTGNGQHEATAALSRLRREIHEQASVPSVADVFSHVSEAEQLLVHQCEPIRHGLTAYWQQAPRCQIGACSLLATAMIVDPWMSLLGALLAFAGYWRFQVAVQSAEERARALHGKAAKSESLLLESIRLAPLAAMFGLAETPGEPFEKNLRLHDAAEHRGHLVRAMLGARAVGLTLGASLLLLAAFCMSQRLPLSAGATIFLALAGASYLAFRLLSLREVVERADAAAEAVFAYLGRGRELPLSSTPRRLQPLAESLRLEGVSWEDGTGRRVLNDATCVIEHGTLTAMLASDEDSPAAIAALLSRLEDPLEGRVLYDQEDIRGAALKDVRQQVSLVSSRPLLFTGTVEENIRCGAAPGSLPIDVTEAAEQCGALAAIRDLPQGMATLVGPLGLDLGRDTSFLVMLARAVVRNPSVLIVEEPEDGELVPAAIRAAARQRTMLLIPSRIDSLRQSARVLVLHQGRIQEQGTHAELLQSSDLYRHMNYMRFNPYQASFPNSGAG
ncbi:MAG: ABC transporter ATP-binding protein [Planctomycetales bacterium]|nr:ABC transporter ATP-binding protein [Planctomycetales bacterium]